MGITPAMAIGGLGAAGSLAGLFGGSKPSNVQLPNMQQTGIGPGQSAAQGAIGGLGSYNVGAQFAPNIAGIGQAYMANPYASGFQGAAGIAGQDFTNAGNAAIGAGGMIGGTVPTQIGAGNAILGTAFDPQSALYNRTQQQVADQSLAGLSATGLAGTPWGQGVQGNTLSNFNIDWQNAQLGREAQGISGANTAFGGALGSAQGAFGLGTGGAGAVLQGGQIPMDAYNQILSNQLQGLGGVANYGNVIGQLPGTQAGDWLSYMSGVNQSNQVANQVASLGLQQQQQGFGQQQVLGQDLGKSLAMMSGQYNPWGQKTAAAQPQPGSIG